MHLNGVSTLDLIWIQRHILGIETLDSPYKMLAADVNNNEAISATDLIELRKLILGHYDEFPDNTSWRFVDADYQFPDVNNPWAANFSETYLINNLESDMAIDFIGVKIGDVNSTAVTNVNSTSVVNRSSRWPLVFNVEEELINQGDTRLIKVTAENYERVTGWQGTFDIDSEKIEINTIQGVAINLDETNFNISKQEKGWIAISYNQDAELDLENGETLFEIQVVAKQDCRVSDILNLSSRVAKAEAYRGLNEAVGLEFRKVQTQELAIVNAKPNPFKEFTEIQIEVPTDGLTSLEIYNMNGQIVHEKNQYYSKGMHSIRVDRTDLTQAGVYYLKLTSGKASSEYKLILID